MKERVRVDRIYLTILLDNYPVTSLLNIQNLYALTILPAILSLILAIYILFLNELNFSQTTPKIGKTPISVAST